MDGGGREACVLEVVDSRERVEMELTTVWDVTSKLSMAAAWCMDLLQLKVQVHPTFQALQPLYAYSAVVLLPPSTQPLDGSAPGARGHV